jgi:hypothetical protein
MTQQLCVNGAADLAGATAARMLICGLGRFPAANKAASRVPMPNPRDLDYFLGPRGPVSLPFALGDRSGGAAGRKRQPSVVRRVVVRQVRADMQGAEASAL